VHLEPVEHAGLDGLDQITRLEPRLFPRVAAHEGGPLEDDVVQLAVTRVVRADRADERAGPKPLAAEHGIARGRRRDHDVLRCRVSVALRRLRADLAAELAEPLLAPAVSDDGVD
jgi:hypothetical protein